MAERPRTTFQWLGTAGFRIEHEDKVILIDPYLDSRLPDAVPPQPLRVSDMSDADYVFVTHNHFDHVADVPAIVAASGARVFCSTATAENLLSLGVPPGKLERLGGDESLDLDSFKVNVFPSPHIKFDLPLILRTAPRVLSLKHLPLMIKAALSKPGVVLAFWFDLGGLSFVHMGSLGMTPDDARYQRILNPDILALPVQGHTHICSRAALLTGAIAPRAVVPQHFDDFFPPVSMAVELLPFEKMVGKILPECRCYEPGINTVFTALDVLGPGSSRTPSGR